MGGSGAGGPRGPIGLAAGGLLLGGLYVLASNSLFNGMFLRYSDSQWPRSIAKGHDSRRWPSCNQVHQDQWRRQGNLQRGYTRFSTYDVGHTG